MIVKQIKSKCKRCGREADSSLFILDPVFKMMVCPECVKERKTQQFSIAKNKAKAENLVKQEEPKPKKEKPAGWDVEDVEAEMAFKKKQAQQTKVEAVGPDKLKYTCPKCKYEFVTNTGKKPARCGYCGHPL
jgi:DNA-directed RNA polymerase subunit RPC12/RpoP